MDKPVSPGLPGILQRQQQRRDPLTQPLSPDEMWHQAVQSQRGFQSSPRNAADKYRRQPATIPPKAAPGDKGSAVGKGYETFSGIQLLDQDGRRVAFGADFFDGGGPENHAEAKIVRGFEKNGAATVPNGRLIVVVERDCCPYCEARLRQFAQKVGLTKIEIHVPLRESLRQAEKLVTPKTAATTSFRNISKPTTITKLRSISISRLFSRDADRFQVMKCLIPQLFVVSISIILAACEDSSTTRQVGSSNIASRTGEASNPEGAPNPRSAQVVALTPPSQVRVSSINSQRGRRSDWGGSNSQDRGRSSKSEPPDVHPPPEQPPSGGSGFANAPPDPGGSEPSPPPIVSVLPPGSRSATQPPRRVKAVYPPGMPGEVAYPSSPR
jgi:hypothetical protein